MTRKSNGDITIKYNFIDANGKKKMGRPAKYNKQLANEICEWMASGRSLTSYCNTPGNVSYPTIMSWLWKDTEYREDFLKQYERSRQMQADFHADEILDIADDGKNDFMERYNRAGESYIVVDAENIQRSRLRVDARKWVASKLRPKKYGDATSIKMSDADSGPVTFVVRYEDKPIPEDNT